MVDIKTLDIYSIIEKYLNLIRDKISIEKVYLFGSYASGKYNANSDIDLAIISPSLSGSNFEDNVFLGKITWNVDTRIEPVGFTPESFSNSTLGFMIKSEGIEFPLNDG